MVPDGKASLTWAWQLGHADIFVRRHTRGLCLQVVGMKAGQTFRAAGCVVGWSRWSHLRAVSKMAWGRKSCREITTHRPALAVEGRGAPGAEEVGLNPSQNF